MNEAAARDVTLLQAFETAQPPSTHWGEVDRVWANRVALEAADAPSTPDEFLAQRARHAMQRLAPRERTAARWLGQPLWRVRWVVATALVAFVLGALADSVGPSQRINLLAPPLWGVLAWNVAVYLLLLGALLAGLLRRKSTAPGPLVRGMQALLQVGRRAPKAGPMRQFAQLWAARSAGLTLLRAETVLHAGAAALGLGLIAGLYARGLVLDYRAAWESTFLGPELAHALVSGVLTPASRLSGIALPDAAGFAALQAAHGDLAAGAPAAPWIQLFAITLALVVVLPRTLLALGCLARAGWRAKRFELPLADPYFQRLLRLQRGGAAHVQVWPYAITPSPQAVLGMHALLAEAFGSRVAVQVDASIAYGAEEGSLPAPAGSTTHGIAWFDLSATPETENHGRFVQQLVSAAPAGASVVVLVDEAAFRRRFGSLPERVTQRRDAWRELCETLDTLPVFADLDAPDTVAIEPALQAALARPARVPVADADRPGEGRS